MKDAGCCCWLVLVSMVLHLSAQPSIVLGDKFNEIRNEVRQENDIPPSENSEEERKKKKRKKKKSYGHGHGDCEDDDDGSILGSLLGEIVGGIITSAFTGRDAYDIRYQSEYDESYGHLHKEGGPWDTYPSHPVGNDSTMLFADYPYADGLDGYMMQGNWGSWDPQTGAGRFWIAYGSDFDDIDRWATRFLVESYRGWGLDTEWNYYTERLSPGVQDHLHVGDFNVLYRFIETEKTQWRLGLGMNWFDSRTVNEYGINATAKLDYYPIHPIVVSGEVDYGTVGDTEIFHGGLSIGLIWRRLELFSGYDYRKIGAVELQGPMFGLRLWW